MGDLEKIQEPMSLKQIFQQMAPEAMSIIQGRVTSASPLKIQVIGDDKLVLTGNILCIPRHLSTYKTVIDISLAEGSINSYTGAGQGTHPHGTSGEHGGHVGGDGSHGHPGSEGAHVHHLTTYAITGAAMTVYNGLKVGDVVYILSFNHGKKYYVLDREA